MCEGAPVSLSSTVGLRSSAPQQTGYKLGLLVTVLSLLLMFFTLFIFQS